MSAEINRITIAAGKQIRQSGWGGGKVGNAPHIGLSFRNGAQTLPAWRTQRRSSSIPAVMPHCTLKSSQVRYAVKEIRPKVTA